MSRLPLFRRVAGRDAVEVDEFTPLKQVNKLISRTIETELGDSRGIEELDVRIFGEDGTEFELGLIDAYCVRQGYVVFVTLELTFLVPIGHSTIQIYGLPYTVLAPSLAGIGFIHRNSTGDKHLITGRPLLSEPGIMEIWYPDQVGTNYVIPVDGEDYGLYLEFFYFTNGDIAAGIWEEDPDNEIIYEAEFDSEILYEANP